MKEGQRGYLKLKVDPTKSRTSCGVPHQDSQIEVQTFQPIREPGIVVGGLVPKTYVEEKKKRITNKLPLRMSHTRKMHARFVPSYKFRQSSFDSSSPSLEKTRRE